MNDETLKQDSAGVTLARELSRRVENKPATVPGFTLLKCLGEGAYGAVWLSREENTGKQVAIKFYTHHRGLDWSLLNREVEKLAVLYTSRNIVRLLGVGWDSNPPYYVMEYLENGSLASFLSEGAIPAHEAVRIAKSVALALVHAHGSGILHCDLKPANILLDADFEPRLCDFGQSRLSNEQSPALGTLFYMAPEQADMNAIPDARWDVYALGALMYHMICGRAPYWSEANEAAIRAAETLEERLAIYRRLLKTSERPIEHRKAKGVDRQLAEIIDRCLRVDPQKRFANAQAALDALELRDRQRARRPLLMLGIVGPIILLLAMSYVVSQVFKKAVNDARATLVQRALESDVHAAQILARSLRRDLDDRQAEFEQIAEDPTLLNAILKCAELNWVQHENLRQAALKQEKDELPWPERDNLFVALKDEKVHGDKIRQSFKRPVDTSWFVTDASGKQLWRQPYSIDSDGETYNYRDYFHGRGVEYKPENVPPDVRPIREPHLSLPYPSKSTKQFTVTVAVPIWDASHETVIGVLGRSTQLGHLMDDYGEGIRGGVDVDRVVALFQTIEVEGKPQVQLLSHPWMTIPQMKELGEDYNKLVLDDADAQSIMRHLEKGDGKTRSVALPEYSDPVGIVGADTSLPDNPSAPYSDKWLAAFVPIEKTHWVTVVQERRDAALTPIADMQREMLRYAVGGLIAGCALVGALWYFVFRALSDRTSRIWSRRSDSGRPSEKGSTV